ncbi:MAG: uracil-DNA glycosylase [Pirellulales bacterium]|jgi:uracil-DNA glycosylase family 4
MSSRALRQRLESLAMAGVTSLPKRRLRRPQETAAVPTPTSSGPTVAASAPAADDRGEALAIIQQEVASCQRCPELAAGRTQTVFGVGPLQPRLCFFGEAPGADEDAAGVPFVGRAGQLLTKIIEACTLSRDEVYILNVLKCRPPGNRRPEPDEVANCRPFFERQFEVLKPEFICCLGATAAQALLDTKASMASLRKQWFDYRGSRVICTYHPSYLLRNPAAKRDVWEDMKLLMAAMGIDVPSR